MRTERRRKMLALLPIALLTGFSQYAQGRGWVREWQVLIALCALTAVVTIVGMVVEGVQRRRGQKGAD